jgi:hypothetical protein
VAPLERDSSPFNVYAFSIAKQPTLQRFIELIFVFPLRNFPSAIVMYPKVEQQVKIMNLIYPVTVFCNPKIANNIKASCHLAAGIQRAGRPNYVVTAIRSTRPKAAV